MPTDDDLRAHVFAVAYRMLGTIADAEDVVQDTWVRWLSRADHADVRSPRAFLATAAARLSIDRLRRRKRERDTYDGRWLPEPIVELATEPAPHEAVARAWSLSPAFLVLLETLAPTERAVLLLRDVFDLDYRDIADVVDKSEANCRQICKRARERVHLPARFDADPSAAMALAARFFTAAADGDVTELCKLLRDDIVSWSDHGGKAAAAKNDLAGVDVVSRYLIGSARKFATGLLPVPARVNGVPGLVLYDGDKVHAVLFAQIDGDHVTHVGVYRNPDKLTRVPRPPG